MFNSIFNIIIILIPLAIFIGRAVSQARSRRAPPPPPPRIPVAFEDDDEYYEDDYVLMPPEPVFKPASSFVIPHIETLPVETLQATGKYTAPASMVSVPQQKGFPFNLSHLSALKQAVVMAEVLNPPKGA